MPENEFEKKVSSEMQDLKFKPSEKVWLHVEERIRKKRRRRVFILIFLLAGLGLLGYWQWENITSNKETSVAVNETTTTENKPTKEETASTTPGNSDEANDKKQNPLQHGSTVQPKNAESARITVPDEKEKSIRKSNQIGQPKAKREAEANNTFRKPRATKNATDEPTVISDQPVARKTPKKDVASSDLLNKQPDMKDVNVKDAKDDLIKSDKEIEPIKVDSAVQSKIEPVLTKADSIVSSNEQKKASELKIPDSVKKKAEPIKDSAAAIKKDHAVKKWRWGFELTPGISSLNEELFSFDMNKAMDSYSGPQQGSSGNPSPPQFPAQPSTSSSGFSFRVGVIAKNEISKRSSLSLGVRYGYYSEHIRVGRDSFILFSNNSNAVSFSTERFYRASNSYRDHPNRYHFLEVPVNYQLRLNKNQQKPFTWNIGFTIGRMIATNAVMYDTAFGGIYYKNTSQLNKTQFSLSTGISWTILNKKSFQWSVGPVVDVHLNSLVNSPFEKKKYLVFAGLRSAVLFNSKK